MKNHHLLERKSLAMTSTTC